MKNSILLIFGLLFLPLVSAEINFEASSYPLTPVTSPDGNYQHMVELWMGANESGDNLLVIDVVYEAGAGWDFTGYEASLNGLPVVF
jgi:hypothetical protein